MQPNHFITIATRFNDRARISHERVQRNRNNKIFIAFDQIFFLLLETVRFPVSKRVKLKILFKKSVALEMNGVLNPNVTLL